MNDFILLFRKMEQSINIEGNFTSSTEFMGNGGAENDVTAGLCGVLSDGNPTQAKEGKYIESFAQDKSEYENYLIQNRENGIVICILKEKKEYIPRNNFQKFILCIDKEKNCLCFFSEDLNFHSDIYDKYLKNGECLGGGFLKVDGKNREIRLCGSSMMYGEVSGKYIEAMKNMLKKKYPEHTISVD